MSMASLLAFAGGAGVAPLSAILAAGGLTLALFWQPGPDMSERMERAWLPLAALLLVRALFHVLVVKDDVVVPVVDLLFLLLVAEALRSLDARNDARIYSLSFALLLASTAYRPGLLFLLAFVTYVCLTTVVLILGHLRREGAKHGSAEIPVSRSFLLGATALSFITLGVAALVFLTFPRVSQSWEGRGETVARSIAGFADEVALGSHGGQIVGNPRIVLRVEFPNGTPENLHSLYWRGRSYDRFDGIRWSRSDGLPPSQAPPNWYDRWGTEQIAQRVYGSPLRTRVLFALHPLVGVEPESPIQPVFNNAGDHTYWGYGPPSYVAYSINGRPTPLQLREAEGSFVPARQYYLQLPPLAPEVQALADSLIGDLPTNYDRAKRLEEWFQEEFTYSLQLPGSPREATLEHFLLNRRAGHCEYFSTAMAIMLRTQGVPAREVNGFLGGSWSQFGAYLAVTQNEAHAWVEVWFPTLGWVPFDPTPAGRGDGTALTSWFWPGRFLFDGIQHRWNKWVLDYSVQTQFDLLKLSREMVRGEPEGGVGDTSTDRRLPTQGPLLLVGTVLLILLYLQWRSRNNGDLPQATRIFLRLRNSSRRAGMPSSALHSPLSLIRHLEAARHPSAPAAKKVVEGYVQARFSGFLLRKEEEEEMLEALGTARSLLRKNPLRRKNTSESD
jgi:transglutaminase-like putative cysteine protease